jgi:hypothetical protein
VVVGFVLHETASIGVPIRRAVKGEQGQGWQIFPEKLFGNRRKRRKKGYLKKLRLHTPDLSDQTSARCENIEARILYPIGIRNADCRLTNEGRKGKLDILRLGEKSSYNFSNESSFLSISFETAALRCTWCCYSKIDNSEELQATMMIGGAFCAPGLDQADQPGGLSHGLPAGERLHASITLKKKLVRTLRQGAG